MANIADADDPQTDAGAGQPSKIKALLADKKKLAIAGVAALALAGGGYFFFLAPHGDAPAEKAAAAPPSFVDLPDMMVNLQVPTDRPKYLKLKIALEVADDKVAHEVEPMIPRVVDSFQTHLREMRPADLEGSAALYRLKEELLRRINQAVYPAKVDAILFKELLLQ